jgi:hypothetical protein
MRGVGLSIFPFLTTTNDGQWSALHPDCFTPDIHFYRTLGGPQNPSGSFGDDGNNLALQRIEVHLVGDQANFLAQRDETTFDVITSLVSLDYWGYGWEKMTSQRNRKSHSKCLV